ncbi:MAG: IS200/IS605 family transposase [Methanocellales archaeon]|nr:IS200/IS605 family transposase [Methanocellales archaeon]
MDLVSGSHRIGQSIYHFEWCPKYRYKMFRREENKKLCEETLRKVAERHNISISELSVMPDHIHVIVEIPTTMSISKAFNLLKGASAYELFRRKPDYRLRYPKGHLWSPGKFYRSIGDTDLETTTNYVRGQAAQTSRRQNRGGGGIWR